MEFPEITRKTKFALPEPFVKVAAIRCSTEDVDYIVTLLILPPISPPTPKICLFILPTPEHNPPPPHTHFFLSVFKQNHYSRIQSLNSFAGGAAATPPKISGGIYNWSTYPPPPQQQPSLCIHTSKHASVRD